MATKIVLIDFFMFPERTGLQIFYGFSVMCLMSVLACILAHVFWSVPVRSLGSPEYMHIDPPHFEVFTYEFYTCFIHFLGWKIAFLSMWVVGGSFHIPYCRLELSHNEFEGWLGFFKIADRHQVPIRGVMGPTCSIRIINFVC